MRKVSSPLVGLLSLTILAFSSASYSHSKGDWLVRVGTATVEPDDSSTTISTQATGALAGTEAGVNSDTQLGLNIVYMLSDNIGLELLAASPFKHDISEKGLDQYGFDTKNLGSTKHLPPTFSVQYYFCESSSVLRPYVGLGINYTVFFDESSSSQAESVLGASDLELDDSIGLAAQAGVDWQINKEWFVNVSVWRMDIDTDASFSSALGEVTVEVEIDPWAYMVAVGYRF